MNYEGMQPSPDAQGVQRGPLEELRKRAMRPIAPEHAIKNVLEHLHSLRTYTARNDERTFGRLPGSAQQAADNAFITETLNGILNVLGFEKVPLNR